MGKKLKDIYPYATRFEVLRFKFNKLMEKVVFTAFIIGLIYGGFKTGQMTTQAENTSAYIAPKEVIVKEKLKFEDFPLLMRICKAESGNRQFNSKGDVLRGHVEPSDVGYCQINEAINNDLARRLGYDIYTEEGNKAFAVHLFTTRGYAPWMASHKSNMPTGWSIE